MVKRESYIKRFKVMLSGLSPNEKKVLALLVQAAELVAPIYAQQVNDKYPGANFYPPDATKEEIEKAAEENPEILDSYTIVERNKSGKLIGIPYHLKYKKQLELVAQLLVKAAKLTENREFAQRLNLQASTLLGGTYEVNDINWLTMPPYKISIIIGPEEKYEDRLFYRKGCYTAVVGIFDSKTTRDLIQLRDIIMSIKRKDAFLFERVDLLGKTQFRADQTLIFAGLDAKHMFSTADFPHDPAMMEKYGSQLIIFKPSLDILFDKELHPIYHQIFEKNFQKSYSPKEMYLGTLRGSVLHEIGHSLVRYRYAEDRLKELYPVIDEIAGSVMGIKACGPLLLKGAISQKELEAILVMFFCRAFYWWSHIPQSPSFKYYAQGYALALNYFLESGAIRQVGGFSWPNFTKMFVGLTELADILEKTLAFGTIEDAQNLIERYGSFEPFNQFLPRLRKAQNER